MVKIKKINVTPALLLAITFLLISCGAPATNKSFEFKWDGGGSTKCTPIYNSDGSFAKSSCVTYCGSYAPSIAGVLPSLDESGTKVEKFLPVENEEEFKGWVVTYGSYLIAKAAVCVDEVYLPNGIRCDKATTSASTACQFFCTNVEKGKNPVIQFDDVRKVESLTRQQLEDKYCKADALPTAPPQADVPPIQPPAELPKPILTGDVTFCNPSRHTFNLRFVDGFDPKNFNHKLTLGGVGMDCSVNPVNPKVLSCAYPASVKFPAHVQVTLNDQVVNDFSYNGSACYVAPKKHKDSVSNCWDLYTKYGLCIPPP